MTQISGQGTHEMPDEPPGEEESGGAARYEWTLEDSDILMDICRSLIGTSKNGHMRWVNVENEWKRRFKDDSLRKACTRRQMKNKYHSLVASNQMSDHSAPKMLASSASSAFVHSASGLSPALIV